MIDLNLDTLNLQIENDPGQDHRIRPITERALERVGERWAIQEHVLSARAVDSLAVPPVNLNLSAMTDEQAADKIAGAILDALALKLRV